MPRMYSAQTRSEVIYLRKSGASWGEIASKVRAIKSPQAAEKIWKEFDATGQTANQPGQGRTPVLTKQMKKRIDAALAKDPWMLPREAVSKLHLPVDPKTVARYRSENYRKVKGVPRPVLSARNKQARLN